MVSFVFVLVPRVSSGTMDRILILGAGFGGISTALGLRERLDPGDEVVLVDRRETFAMGLRKNWGIAGMEPHRLGERPLDALRTVGSMSGMARSSPSIPRSGQPWSMARS